MNETLDRIEKIILQLLNSNSSQRLSAKAIYEELGKKQPQDQILKALRKLIEKGLIICSKESEGNYLRTGSVFERFRLLYYISVKGIEVMNEN